MSYNNYMIKSSIIEPKGDLSREAKKAALHYLIIKGCGCAYGRKQRAYTPKEEARAPTVTIESVKLSCMIDAKEERDVTMVLDIPGAFLHADMEDLVHMKFKGKMAELLIKLEPMEWWGFEVNPYNWCMANKTIIGKQCTVLWHVNDLKILHVDPKVVKSPVIKQQLASVFGKEAPLTVTVTHGKVQDYLGMTINYTSPGKVKIIVIDYVKNMLKELPSNMDEDVSEIFHHDVAKLLFLFKRATTCRLLDLQTAVVFMCTRVKCPDSGDYKKLRCMMKYLRGTLEMPLILEAGDNMQIVKWWVDACSYAVHPDMKSHTGGIMSLGKGAVYTTSSEQKLNTKSSTEAKLVGINDILVPQMLWTRYWLGGAQGYDVKESIRF
eukprot:scaffold7210_cov63-Attheya_sp.AAC.3